MSNYRELKQRHEAAVVDDFVHKLNQKLNLDWKVIARPNPPDAIITNGNMTTWIEHTDLYRTWEEARSETSFLTPGKTHIPHRENPIYAPSQRTAKALMSRLQEKLSNSSYRRVYEEYGQGYLVISERDPLFDIDTIADIDHMTEQVKITGDLGYFHKAYLAIRVPQDMIYEEITYHRE